MRKTFRLFKAALQDIHPVDLSLVLFMCVLLIRSVLSLVLPANTPTAAEIDIIMRTSTAAIFGYLLSGNFMRQQSASSSSAETDTADTARSDLSTSQQGTSVGALPADVSVSRSSVSALSWAPQYTEPAALSVTEDAPSQPPPGPRDAMAFSAVSADPDASLGAAPADALPASSLEADAVAPLGQDTHRMGMGAEPAALTPAPTDSARPAQAEDPTQAAAPASGSSSHLQVAIATGIGLFCLIVLSVLRDLEAYGILSAEADTISATIIQFRDIVAGCVGFLIGRPTERGA